MTDTANRLSEDDQFTYVYDANGNLTSKTAKAGGGVTGYSYDAQNQLTRIDFPDLSFAAYRYDGLGRRFEKDVNGALTQYVYDGSDILIEFDGAGTLLARTSHGQGSDQPLAVERGGQSFYYQADHRGSVRKITDAAGLVVNSYDYDSYGNIEASVEAIANPFTYTGREFDAESGLYYYRARYYDPATGRFLQEDPIGFGAGDLNLYRYVFNDPVNFTDPDGRIAAVIAVPVAACLASPACLAALAVAEAALDTLAVYIAAEIAIESVQMSPADEGSGSSDDAAAGGKSCPDGRELTGGGDAGSGDEAKKARERDLGQADKQKKGRPGDPQRQNKQVKDAAREAGLSPEQRRELGREVETLSRDLGENLGFQDILGIAKDIKSGNF